ncbi:hypothetical protein HKBW3S25_01951, partial [Candidatus Hakubella thermalkaliphila]
GHLSGCLDLVLHLGRVSYLVRPELFGFFPPLLARDQKVSSGTPEMN